MLDPNMTKSHWELRHVKGEVLDPDERLAVQMSAFKYIPPFRTPKTVILISWNSVSLDLSHFVHSPGSVKHRTDS